MSWTVIIASLLFSVVALNVLVTRVVENCRLITRPKAAIPRTTEQKHASKGLRLGGTK
jgi:hypothetical protein